MTVPSELEVLTKCCYFVANPSTKMVADGMLDITKDHMGIIYTCLLLETRLMD